MRRTIGHVLPFPTIGGTEQATLRIAQAVKPYGFDSVAFYGRGTRVGAHFQAAGFPTVAFDPVEPSYTRPGNYWEASRAVAKAFREVDLIHCADILAAHYTSFGGLLSRTPILCHVRCRHSPISKRDASFLWPVKKFLFVSQKTWSDFGVKVPPARGEVVYDGIAVRPVEPARIDGVPPGQKIIGMAARVGPPKDYQTLIRAAARVIAEHPEVTFVIVGDHSSEPLLRDSYADVRRMLAEHHLDDSFVFTGFRSDIEEVIAAMDIAVLCSHTEGLPLFLLEAMAQNKPVVATNVGGIPEVIADGRTGLLHEPDNAEDLAAKLLLLLNRPEEASRLAAGGHDLVLQRFTNEQFAAHMARIYRDMTGGGTIS